MPVTRANHRSGCDIKGGEQGSGAMTQLVMGASLDHARTHGEQRLGTVQCLDL